MQRLRLLTAGVLCSLLASGCAQRLCGLAPYCQQPVIPLSQLLPSAERGKLRIAVDSDSPRPSPQYDYHVLSPREAQCLAAQNSSLGNLLDKHRDQMAHKSDPRNCCQRMMIDILSSAALEARNRTAGAALELYYTLAKLEAQRDLLDQSLAELVEYEGEITHARSQGLSLPLSSEEVSQQRLEAERKMVELELGITQANRALAKLLGASWDNESVRIWPQTDLRVVAQPFDPESEVALALDERPELNVARALASSGCIENLPTMRAAVTGAAVFLAASPLPGSRLISKLATVVTNDPVEVVERQRQLETIAMEREQAVRDDVLLVISTIAARHDQAVLASRGVRLWDERVNDLERGRDIDKSKPDEVLQGRLKRYEARSQLVEAVIAWKIAQVKLREAQGQLVFECLSGADIPVCR